MSYDLQIWSVKPVRLPGDFPDPGGWEQSTGCWVHEESNWQISLFESRRVEPEDVPEGIEIALPGISFLSEIHLQPMMAGVRPKKLIHRTAIALAKAAHGVVLDPQLNSLTLPTGLKRLLPLNQGETVSLLSLSWWFERGPLAEEAEIGGLVDVIKATLPEVLPRRYDLYEPPRFSYAETGEDPFRTFVKQFGRGLGLVWYPHPPVAHVNLSIPERVGGSWAGYRSARLTIDVDAGVLEQPGWEVAIRRFWRRVSALVRPFYGDVRTISGYRRVRNRYWFVASMTGGTGSHPVQAWWWNGIPPGPVHAVVLGEPYLELWPEFVRAAKLEGDLAFICAPSWSGHDSICQIVPTPEPIAQPSMQYKGEIPVPQRQYPPSWPFESPFSVA